MEKITYIYSHDHGKDTTIGLVKCPGRTQIEIDFDMEDPNVGKEIAVYGTDEDVDFVALALEWLDEINAFLDGDKSQAEVYEEYTSNMWYCICKSLDWLINKKLTCVNKDGNKIQIVSLREAAKIIKTTMVNDFDTRFNFGIGISNMKIENFINKDYKDSLFYYGVKLIPNDEELFDGCYYCETDYIFICGRWGGGNITVATYSNDPYTSIEEQDPEAEQLLKAMMESCGATNPNEKILLETVKTKKEAK